MTSQQSVNTKIIACFPSSLFFVIIKRDFITDYLNIPAFSQNFWFELFVLVLVFVFLYLSAFTSRYTVCYRYFNDDTYTYPTDDDDKIVWVLQQKK